MALSPLPCVASHGSSPKSFPDTLTPPQAFTLPQALPAYLKYFPGAFFFQNPDLSLSYISESVHQIFENCDIAQLKQNFLQLLYHQDRFELIQHLKHGPNPEGILQLKYRLKHPNQDTIAYILDIRSPRYHSKGYLLGYEGIWINCSRQAIAETQLSASSWREHLALLTSGLIHDFSNVITGIYSLSELYHSILDPKHSMFEGLGQIKKNALEAQKLIRRIIELNRESSGKSSYHSLEKLIQDQLDLFRILLPQHIELETLFTGEDIPVYIDDVGFRQVCLNLAMNARDAIIKKGKVRIQTRLVGAQEPIFLGAYGGSRLAPKKGVEILFQDTGGGIAPEHLHCLFQPFFSTKDTYKGAGLGLYNMQVFIQDAGGLLGVKSELRRGTSFFIYLPLAEFKTASHPPLALEKPSQEIKRHRAIAYASKPPQNFELVQYLTEQEWEVLSFTDPFSLIAYLKQTKLQMDLFLVLDIGKDTYATSLLDYFKAYYPQVCRGVQVIGSDAPRRDSLKGTAHLLLDRHRSPNEALGAINTYLNTPA